MKMQRLMGGAGIFTNAEFVDALLPRLDGLAREVADFYLCARRPHARTPGPATTAARAGRDEYANCTRPVRSHMFYVHDVFFSRIVEEMAIDLTPVDFLFGTEPAVYVCGPARAGAEAWPAHPPFAPRFGGVGVPGPPAGNFSTSLRLRGANSFPRFAQAVSQCTIRAGLNGPQEGQPTHSE